MRLNVLTNLEESSEFLNVKIVLLTFKVTQSVECSCLNLSKIVMINSTSSHLVSTHSMKWRFLSGEYRKGD